MLFLARGGLRNAGSQFVEEWTQTGATRSLALGTEGY
jgi:hypothetical protein